MANIDSTSGNPIRKELQHTDRLLALGGYLFLAISAFAFCLLAYSLTVMDASEIDFDGDDTSQLITAKVFGKYSKHIISFFVGLTSGILGYVLLRSAGAAYREVIPRQDAPLLYELLRSNNEQALKGYIDLAGLSGVVGLFTKLGVNGLPLATIGLTVFLPLLGCSLVKQLVSSFLIFVN
jgi:hypothetical protein